ncbi:MAG: sodium:proton exchanger, partial [Novosphingobium sp.]
VEAVHETFPKAAIYVRAFDRRALIRLRGTPVSAVVREVMESAVKMARIALSDAGLSEEAVRRAEDMFRASDRERLKLQIEAGDVRVARDRIITKPQIAGD